MSRIERRPRVRRDLVNIYRYIARDSETAARRMLDRLETNFERLAGFPEMGRSVAIRHEGLRYLLIEPYLVVYRPLERKDGIELIRILHSARNWRVLLEDEAQ